MVTTTTKAPSTALTSFVVASRYMPVYIALALLVVVAFLWAPATLSSVALRAVAPYGAVLGITALGQMLVIMTGGIDLSVPGTMSLAAVIMVGVGEGSNEQIAIAIVKSGTTTSDPLTCTTANSPPVAILEVKTPACATQTR